MSDFKPVNQAITPMSADPGEEFPFLHTITVVDRVVSVDKPELVQNNIKTETVTLNLDSEWDGLSCIINIGNSDTPTSLIWSGQPVTIPAELMTEIGTLNVSVVGYGDDGALRAVTKKADAMFTVVASGYVEGDEPVPDPTTILGQLTEAADRANQAAQTADSYMIKDVTVTMTNPESDGDAVFEDNVLDLRVPRARGLTVSYVADNVDSLPKQSVQTGALAMVNGTLYAWNGTQWVSQGTPTVSGRDGIRVWKNWQDPTLADGNDVRDGDLWIKTPHYLTDIDSDNVTEGASTAEFYTYALGEEDNSPSVLVQTSQVVTDILEYSNGTWLSLIWRVDSNLTPASKRLGVQTTASALSETQLLTRIEALEIEVNNLKGLE